VRNQAQENPVLMLFAGGIGALKHVLRYAKDHSFLYLTYILSTYPVAELHPKLSLSNSKIKK
jgi:predicted transcriptional regulator